MKKNLFICLSIFLANASYGSDDYEKTRNQERNETIEQLKNKGIIKEGSELKIKDLGSNSAGSTLGDIFFIKVKNPDGTCKLVGKIFSELDKFTESQKELKDFTDSGFPAILETVNMMSKDCGARLPQFIEYHLNAPIKFQSGRESGFIIMSKASGIELAQLIVESLNMDDETIQKTFQSIGEQSGNFDKLVFQRYGYTIKHPDPNYNNFLYDRKRDQFYWIDFENLKINPEFKNPSTLDGTGEYYTVSNQKKIENKSVFTALLDGDDMSKKHPRWIERNLPKDENDRIGLYKKLLEQAKTSFEKAFLAQQSLFEGLYKSLKGTALLDHVLARHKSFIENTLSYVNKLNSLREKYQLDQLNFNQEKYELQ